MQVPVVGVWWGVGTATQIGSCRRRLATWRLSWVLSPRSSAWGAGTVLGLSHQLSHTSLFQVASAPLYRLKPSETERRERVYHAGSQEAGCWALNPVSIALQLASPAPQGAGWLRPAPRRAHSLHRASRTGAVWRWVLAYSCVRLRMFQSCLVLTTRLGSSTR